MGVVFILLLAIKLVSEKVPSIGSQRKRQKYSPFLKMFTNCLLNAKKIGITSHSSIAKRTTHKIVVLPFACYLNM